MADHGTVIVVEPELMYEVTGYAMAGTGPTGPTVPTTGQIWPRGSG